MIYYLYVVLLYISMSVNCLNWNSVCIYCIYIALIYKLIIFIRQSITSVHYREIFKYSNIQKNTIVSHIGVTQLDKILL